LVALSSTQLEGLEHNSKIVTEFGIGEYKLLNKFELQSELNSPLYHGGAFVSGGGIVNPVKLVDKIRSEAAKLGVRFIERCRVLEISGSELKCESGSISCKKIVLATDSYSHHLVPALLRHFIPLYDYIIVSEPLSAEQRKAIGWRNRQGVVDCRNFFNYYRLTADNRILWGTSEALYFAPNRVDESCDHSDEKYTSLRASFARHFPQISELNFTYQWGGPIASTTRLTPFFGSLAAGKVVYGLGYTGHGIGSTRVAGKILAHMTLSQINELTALEMVQKKPFPYPPEPFRGMAVNMVTKSLRDIDAGGSPGMMLKILDILGIGFSS
jgi:glycine/D-amino acid oxidase-like deaminating enzyme